jgi:hypothetical protein
MKARIKSLFRYKKWRICKEILHFEKLLKNSTRI